MSHRIELWIFGAVDLIEYLRLPRRNILGPLHPITGQRIVLRSELSDWNTCNTVGQWMITISWFYPIFILSIPMMPNVVQFTTTFSNMENLTIIDHGTVFPDVTSIGVSFAAFSQIDDK